MGVYEELNVFIGFIGMASKKEYIINNKYNRKNIFIIKE